MKLAPTERVTLQEAYANHSSKDFRSHCQAILLSSHGLPAKQIASIFEVRTRTVYTWMNRWESEGICGLMIRNGRGRKARLSVADSSLVGLIKKKAVGYARSLKRFAADLSNELGMPISVSVLKRFLKRLGYCWKRFRKSLKKKQDKAEYEAKCEELKQLLSLYHTGYINLFFADESGFNLEGYVPYGWQPKGEYLTILPSKSPSTQIFGIMNLENELHAYSKKGSMDSRAVIAFIDDFHQSIKQPTVIVMDNAPIHKSHLFQEKVEQWKQDDLFIFFLPTYSPHLNPIEILWRMIKYQWLEYERIQNEEQLIEELERILRTVGSDYFVNFKKSKVSI